MHAAFQRLCDSMDNLASHNFVLVNARLCLHLLQTSFNVLQERTHMIPHHVVSVLFGGKVYYISLFSENASQNTVIFLKCRFSSGVTTQGPQ